MTSNPSPLTTQQRLTLARIVAGWRPRVIDLGELSETSRELERMGLVRVDYGPDGSNDMNMLCAYATEAGRTEIAVADPNAEASPVAAVLVRAMKALTLDGALEPLQRALGIMNGDNAGVYFSGTGSADCWLRMNAFQRAEVLASYVEHELLMAHDG